MALIAAAAAFAGSLILTGLVRRYAIERALLDVPNERSSHTSATPRGGGLAIVAVIVAGTAIGAVSGAIRSAHAAALLGGLTLVAGVGWVDDRSSLSARVRVLCHFAAAIWAVAWLGGLPDLRVGNHHVHLGLFGGVVAVVGIVWLVNLYNFMDGIDGIAGAEAVMVSLGAMVLASLAGGDPSIIRILAIVAGASAGFLRWNWMPAKIFMGDVGSGALGFSLAVVALASERGSGPPVLAWLILLAAFIGDATLTLIRRVVRRERWYAAHRSHAYQRATQLGLSHQRVTLWVVAIDAALIALAVLALRVPQAAAGVGLAAVLIVGGAYVAVERAKPM